MALSRSIWVWRLSRHRNSRYHGVIDRAGLPRFRSAATTSAIRLEAAPTGPRSTALFGFARGPNDEFEVPDPGCGTGAALESATRDSRMGVAATVALGGCGRTPRTRKPKLTGSMREIGVIARGLEPARRPLDLRLARSPRISRPFAQLLGLPSVCWDNRFRASSQ